MKKQLSLQNRSQSVERANSIMRRPMANKGYQNLKMMTMNGPKSFT